MALVRAVYRNGKLELLDEVDLQDGQEVRLEIVEKSGSIQDIVEGAVNPIIAAIHAQLEAETKTISPENLVGDMLVHFNPDATELDEDAIQQELDQVLTGKRPLSEIIIEERREGR